MFQSSGIHCTKFKRSDGFIFSKPMFSALNIVTCSSAISKGFFSSHISVETTLFVMVIRALQMSQRREKKNKLALTMTVMPTEGFQLLGNYIKGS